MTYYNQTTTYEFTAFSMDDLRPGETRLDCGEHFTMPASASLCIEVTDDDKYLSGDCYDQANDHQQHASISDGAGGPDIGNGGQIYAESYLWVWDATACDWRLMIEIEQEGSHEKFYTFHEAYGVPAEGAELHVHSICNVSGNWVDYDCLTAGECEPVVEVGSISGTVWCDLDCDGIQDVETTVTKGEGIFTDSVTFESVECTTYNVDCYGSWYSVGHDVIDLVVGGDQGHSGNAHDNTLVELDKGGIWCRQFEVAESGTYCLTLDVYKNDCIPDGDNKFTIKINGEDVAVETVNADGTIEISIELQAGHNQIDFASNSTVHGYGVGIDNIQIAPLVEETVSVEPAKEGVTVKLIDSTGAVVETTTTDADGNYSFDDVPVGDYTIMGVAPDGTEFTIQDAGSDDSVDSDVNADGVSNTITVTKDANVDVDLGVCEKAEGSISGRYFDDVNEDGLDNDGATNGIAGITVLLLDAMGTPTGETAVTDADGNYSFADVPAGTYGVQFVDPDTGRVLTAQNVDGDVSDDIDSDADAAGVIQGIVVVAGEDNIDNDAGVVPAPGSISGTYFCDENDNDVRDAGEALVADAVVTLSDANGVVATTTTDANGNYSFADVPAGDYTISFAPQTGKDFVAQDDPNGNGDDTNDSDVDATGSTPVTVTPGEETVIDAGVEELPGSISGTYFCDENDNDVRDAGEALVADAVVTLSDANGVVATTTTDANGNYSFADVPAGDYTISFAPQTGKDFVAQDDPNGNGDDTNDSDVDATGSTPVTVTPGEETVIDAGVEELPGSISGTYFCDENDNDVRDAGEALVADAVVTLSDANGVVATTTTDANGNYSFADVPAGDYTISFEAPAGKDFVAQDDPNGNGDDTNDSDVDATGSTPVTVTPGEETVIDAGVEELPGSISGTYFCDENDNDVRDAGEALVADAVVTLSDANGVVATTTTDANGNYSFADVPAGDYTISFEAPAGKDFVAQDDPNGNGDDTNDSDVDATGSTPVTVTPGEETVIDAGVEELPGSISGTYFCDENDNDVRDAGEALVADAVVTLSDANGVVATTTTDANGNYSFADVPAGDYTISFAPQTGKDFVAQDDPNGNGDDTNDSDVDATGSTPVTVTPGEETVIDAGVEELPGSISGTYFCDENDNDVRDAGEALVADAVVTLSDANGVVATTTTDANGNYSFADVPAGDYTISFAPQTGKDFVAQDDPNGNGDDTNDSDVDATGSTPVTVTPGEETVIDAGVEELPGSISGRYFDDVNEDGLDNDGATNGIAGITVLLLDAMGTPTGETAVTDADGNYSFADVPAGTYGVQFVDPDTGRVLTAQNVDGDVSDDIDSDADAAGVIQGIVVVAGEDNIDNDAGVVPANGHPDPEDDEGMGCANEIIEIDVLDNDSDPDGDTLTVTQVNGLDIAEGDMLDIDGVFVSLVGGKLQFNGEAAYVDLDFGDSEFADYTYTVEDGNGGSAMADIEVKFCGVAETVAEICDTLPATLEYQLLDNYAIGSDEAFSMKLTSEDGRFNDVVIEAAYCVSVFDPADAGEALDFSDAPIFAANLYCAIASEVPDDVLAGQVGFNGQSAEDNLDNITWLLNQDFSNNGYTDAEVQAAIWGLTDSFEFIAPGFGDIDNVRELVALASDTANDGYEAGPGGIVALIVDPNPTTNDNAQPFIIGVEFDQLDCVCDMDGGLMI